MDKTQLLETTYAIQQQLKESALVKKCVALEDALFADVTAIPLIAAFKKAEDLYNEALRFNLNDVLQERGKALSAAKEKLYAHPRVQEYFATIKEASAYLNTIAEKMFNGLIYDIGVAARNK